MALSYQAELSDGTLQRVLLSIDFFDTKDIRVTQGNVILVDTVDYHWDGRVAINLTNPVPAGVLLILRRHTDIARTRLTFNQGAPFVRQNIDSQNKQFLFLAQETAEGAFSDVYDNLDMHMYNIINLADPIADTDATNKRWVKETFASALANTTQSREAIRRTYAEVGLTLVKGSFEEGGILNAPTDILIYDKNAKCYAWQGALPKTVPAKSTPESTGGIGADKWQDVTNTTQHSQAQYSGGVDYKTYYAWQGRVTLQYKDEAVQFKQGGMFYRWDGTFPQGGLIIPKNTPEPSPAQTGAGKYVVVIDLAVTEKVVRTFSSPSGASLVGTKRGLTVQDFIDASFSFDTIDDVAGAKLQLGAIVNVRRYSNRTEAGGGKFIVVKSGSDDGVLTFVRGANRITRVRTKGQPIMLSQCGLSGTLSTNVARFSAAAAVLVGKHPICIDGIYALSGSNPVVLPRNFHLTGFGSTESPRFGNISAWAGFDLSFYKGSSLLYGEIPVLLQCSEGVYLSDFDMAGNLTASMNGKAVNPNTLTESSFVGVTAIKFNKYIRTKNVTASLVHRHMYSTRMSGEQGNYYSRHDNTDCYFSWRYIESDSAPLYNCRFTNCRIGACSPFRFNAGANNTTFVGGSVEGYNTYSGCSGTGDITFYGTYFETFYTGATPIDLFFVTGSVSIVFNEPLIYANNCQSLVRTNATSKVRAEINGGRIVMAAGQVGTCYVFNPGDNNALMRAKFSPETEIQVSGGFSVQIYRFNLPIGQTEGLSNTLSELYYIPAGGISLKPLSAVPQLASSGCVFCANGTTWNPLDRATGYPYWVLYSDGFWLPVSG